MIEHPLVHRSGVFFGLPEAEYHQALALSASGVKHLRISTMDFWARCPALNPDWVDEETEAKLIGKAYHRRIVEGAEVFAAHYAAKLDPDAFPDALRTIEDLTQALARHLVRPKSTWRKPDYVARLRELEPAAEIWDEIAREHLTENSGKTLLDARLVGRIMQAARLIESHPQLGRAFAGGMPEVSVFWEDRETGIPMKARFDYLLPRAVVDLKSFSNALGLPIRRAVARAIANYRYHVQAALYLEAAAIARELIGEGRVSGEVDKDFLAQVCDGADKTFLFVFQQTGAAPVARGVVLAPGITLDLAAAEINDAKYAFARAWERYGTEPWYDEAEIDTFDSADLPAYFAG
ncbi:MAG TPA: PD-(D/E)XK nuclease-like domain-containing protein [Xanthobacteraceae bacterium]|nr:PD-(D/E)XK nuclease-like domain-containing protein [Xanthobacteraceae bacterium]